MRARLSLIAVVCFLFLPTFVRANSLSTWDDRAIFRPDASLYRLRQATKPWQLVGLPAGFSAEDYHHFNNRLYLVGSQGGQKSLLFSDDGLRFVASGIVADQIVIKSVGPWLVIGARTGATITATRVNAELAIEALPGGPLVDLAELDHLIELNGSLILARQNAAVIDLLTAQATNWVKTAELDCPTFTIMTTPLVAVRCSDQLHYPLAPNNWLALFPAPIRQLDAGKGLIAQSAVATDTFYLFRDNTLSTVTLTGFGDPLTTQAVEKNGRFFLRGTSLWELVTEPIFQLVVADANPAATLIAADNSSRIYLRSGAREAASDAPATWQTITVAGDYTNARPVVSGWLLWKQNGSVTQLASGDESAYHLISTTWAASSRIQEIALTGSGALLFLYNSSNKANLYKTADFSQWTRITLPTQPTQAVSVATARSLPAGSLVDVVGGVTAGTGVVSSDTLYIQDQTGGIQIFLSASKGSLPAVSQRAAEAVGEVSSAQTKRIVLEAADDITLGDPLTVALAPATAVEAISQLGWSLTINGKISGKTTDYLSLEAATALLRLHYKALANSYAVGDSGSFPAVIDFNSSSGQVEAWLIGPDILTNHPTAPPTVSEPTTTSVATEPGDVAELTQASRTSVRSVVADSRLPDAELQAETLLPVATDSALVAPVSTTNASTGVAPPEALAMSVLSLIAGLVSLRGRRFRALFGAPSR